MWLFPSGNTSGLAEGTWVVGVNKICCSKSRKEKFVLQSDCGFQSLLRFELLIFADKKIGGQSANFPLPAALNGGVIIGGNRTGRPI